MQDFKYDSEECGWQGGSEEACSRPPMTMAPTEDWLDSAALIDPPLAHAAHCYSLILPTGVFSHSDCVRTTVMYLC